MFLGVLGCQLKPFCSGKRLVENPDGWGEWGIRSTSGQPMGLHDTHSTRGSLCEQI